MSTEFAVIGLGLFGRTVALSLAHAGHPVLAIDRSEVEVQHVAEEIDHALVLDTTDESALRELGLERLSCVVVAIGTGAIEASILTTALLRQIGVVRIVARAVSELHGRVLQAVGAHEVVNPEAEMGKRVALRVAQPSVLERFRIGGGIEAAEIECPEALTGQTVVDADVRRRFGVTVAAIRRDKQIDATIDGRERLVSGDVLLVIGPADAIRRLAALA